jgi:general secretion pathway protein G
MRLRGFTLIELLVVMAIVATLLSIVAPRYFNHLDHAREAALRQTLNVARDAIDKYHADKGRYPASLDELVESRYLRQLPIDPVADKPASWVLLPPSDGTTGGILDLHSSASGAGSDGVSYGDY